MVLVILINTDNTNIYKQNLNNDFILFICL